MLTARPSSRLAAAAATLLLAAILLPACGWAQYGYGPAHDGFNPFETTIGPASVPALRLRWSQPVGGESPPVIANGVLYLASDKLYALDASTGSARWSTPQLGTSGAVTSPAVANGVVYVVPRRDQLHAFDAGNGSARWSKHLGEAGSSPTVAQGVVYVSGWDNEGAWLYAFDATTGTPLWSAAAGSPVGRGPLPPAVADGVVYVGADKFYAFNATTGAPLWSAAAGNPEEYFGSPAVANGVVYVGADKFYAFNATTGALLWSAAVVSRTRPAVANGVVYVGAYVEKLYALNATTGAQVWATVALTGDVAPVVANGVVYAASDRLYGYNAATGAKLWSGPQRGTEPVIANGVVYTGANAYSLPITTPLLSISPAFPPDFNFGYPELRTFTVTNIGSTATSVITDSLTGADAAHFRLSSDGCTGTSLAGGATCTVTASFVPTEAGPRTAWLSATATAGGTARALLRGTAQPFTVSPAFTNFGDVFAGSTSTREFSVTNLGAAPLGPIADSITASGFAITADACARTTLAAGASCTVTVKFAPTSNLDYGGTLVTQAAGARAEAWLSGRGLAGLAIAPDIKDFGQVGVGTTASATFTVSNISPTPAGPITDAIDARVGGGFSITSDTCAGRTLASSANCTIVVTFAPTSAGWDWAYLRTYGPSSGTAVAILYGAGT